MPPGRDSRKNETISWCTTSYTFDILESAHQMKIPLGREEIKYIKLQSLTTVSTEASYCSDMTYQFWTAQKSKNGDAGQFEICMTNRNCPVIAKIRKQRKQLSPQSTTLSLLRCKLHSYPVFQNSMAPSAAPGGPALKPCSTLSSPAPWPVVR